MLPPVDAETAAPDAGGAMSKYSLALLCALCLTAGGAAAFVLHHAGRDAAEVRGVSERSVDAPPASQPEAVESGPGEPARARDAGAAGSTEDAETWEASVESVERVETDGAGVRVGATAGRRGARVRAEAGSAPSVGGQRVASRPARVSGGRADSGGRGIAGHALGGVKATGKGVKKTGVAIGKTVGKIGGVFHD